MARSIATPPPVRQPTARLRAYALPLAGALCLVAACRGSSTSPSQDAGAGGVPAPSRRIASADATARPSRVSPDAHAPASDRPQPTAPATAGTATADAAVLAPADARAPVAVDAGPLPTGTGFLGLDDEAILGRICDAPVERIERNRGGSTVSFRVWLAGGQRGLFKPQQRSEVANYRAELAAYRLSRLLGLHRTPPACGRTMPRDRLQRIADASGDPAFSQRVMTELLGRGDAVPGAMLFWVPGALEPVPGADRYAALLGAGALDPADRALAAELSALLLFDFLTDNVDRWSGGNILRQRTPPGQPPGAMLFMDNGASFSALHDGMGARPQDQAARLDRVQRFPRALVAAMRALTPETLRAAVGRDPLGPCLSDLQIAAVIARRDRLLRHVEATVAARGEAEAMPF